MELAIIVEFRRPLAVLWWLHSIADVFCGLCSYVLSLIHVPLLFELVCVGMPFGVFFNIQFLTNSTYSILPIITP